MLTLLKLSLKILEIQKKIDNRSKTVNKIINVQKYSNLIFEAVEKFPNFDRSNKTRK